MKSSPKSVISSDSGNPYFGCTIGKNNIANTTDSTIVTVTQNLL